MQDQTVFIVGAGNSAGQAALHLAKHARQVTLLVRGHSLAKSMSSYLIRAIDTTPNVAVRFRTDVVGGGGAEALEYVELADRARGTTEEVPAAALFIMIGGVPHTEWLPDEIVRDGQGYLTTGRDLLEQGAASRCRSRRACPAYSRRGTFGRVRSSESPRPLATVRPSYDSCTNTCAMWPGGRRGPWPPERRRPRLLRIVT